MAFECDCATTTFYLSTITLIGLYVATYIISKNIYADDFIPRYANEVFEHLLKTPIINIDLSNPLCTGNHLKLGFGPTYGKYCIESSVPKGNALFSSDFNDFNFYSDFKRNSDCVYTKYYTSTNDLQEYKFSTTEAAISNWRKSYFCSSSESRSYKDLIIVSKGQKCPNNSIKCLGSIDNLDNELCVDSALSCPINYIAIADMNIYEVNEPNMKVTYFEPSSNSNNSRMAIIYSNSQIPLSGYKHRIISRIGITEGYPCAAPYENSKPFSQADFLFDGYFFYNRCLSTYTSSTSQTSINYNPNITPIDSDYSINVFNDNYLLRYLVNLPYYPTESLYKKDYVLWVDSYPGIQSSCSSKYKSVLEEYSDKYLDNKYYDSDYESSGNTNITYRKNQVMVISIILISFTAFTFLQPFFTVDDNFFCFFGTLINGLLLLGILGTNIALLVISFQGNDSVHYWAPGFSLYQDLLGCFDDYNNYKFSLMNEFLNSMSNGFIASGVIAIIAQVLGIFQGILCIVMMSRYPD